MKRGLLFTTAAYVLLIHLSAGASSPDSCRRDPLTFETSYTGDWVHNLAGGIRQGNRYLGLANITLEICTEKAGLFRGGSLFVNAANTHGGEPSAELFGDFQVISNLEAGNLTYLHELWYRQELGNTALILGLQDLNSTFAESRAASLFLNSSFGIHSTIASNLPVPIFPLTALGIKIQHRIGDRMQFAAALFDGLPDDFSTNPNNLRWRLQKDDGYLAIAELTFRIPSETHAGTWKIGTYYHNEHSVTLIEEGISTTTGHPENHGFYLAGSQHLHTGIKGRSLSAFAQASVSPQSKNENHYYLGGGLCYSGLIAKRTYDHLGLAVAHAGFTGKSETAIELTYKAVITENLFIQPDLQYVINPCGTGASLKNAVAGIFRFGFVF